MAGKPGARDGASNHHSQATGQMEADLKKTKQKQISVAVLVQLALK